MLLAQVVGQVVATVKEPGLSSFKLLLCVPFEQAQERTQDSAGPDAPQPDAFVAIDLVGAGFGEVVLVVAGSAARVAAVAESAPVDSAIVGIVDSVTDRGTTTYSTS